MHNWIGGHRPGGRGFTLLELVIVMVMVMVMVIIGVVSAIAFTGYNTLTKKSRTNALKGTAWSLDHEAVALGAADGTGAADTVSTALANPGNGFVSADPAQPTVGPWTKGGITLVRGGDGIFTLTKSDADPVCYSPSAQVGGTGQVAESGKCTPPAGGQAATMTTLSLANAADVRARAIATERGWMYSGSCPPAGWGCPSEIMLYGIEDVLGTETQVYLPQSPAVLSPSPEDSRRAAGLTTPSAFRWSTADGLFYLEEVSDTQAVIYMGTPSGQTFTGMTQTNTLDWSDRHVANDLPGVGGTDPVCVTVGASADEPATITPGWCS